jgi:hypothetical protein
MDWEHVRIYLPRAQRRRVIEAAAFERTEAAHAKRIYSEELAERPGDPGDDVSPCKGGAGLHTDLSRDCQARPLTAGCRPTNACKIYCKRANCNFRLASGT